MNNLINLINFKFNINMTVFAKRDSGFNKSERTDLFIKPFIILFHFLCIMKRIFTN